MKKINQSTTNTTTKTRFKPKLAMMAALLSLGVLSGCITDQGNKQLIGSVLGAGAGGYAGSNIGGGKGKLAATAAGAILGGLFGNSIGGSLDCADKQYAARAQNVALEAPVGKTIAWSNPETGNRGKVTPTRSGRDTRTGAYCREYQTEVIVGSEAQVGYGTACQMPDGDWKIES